jgi:hypothetical protein
MEPEGSLPQSQVPATYSLFRNIIRFLRWGVFSTSPNPQAGGPPFLGYLRLLIQYIRSYPPYWRPFLHLQPEDAPCRGDRDPLITAFRWYSVSTNVSSVWRSLQATRAGRNDILRLPNPALPSNKEMFPSMASWENWLSSKHGVIQACLTVWRLTTHSWVAPHR